MEDNRTPEEEEIVHENTVIDFPIKNHIALGIINAIAIVTLFGLPVLAHFFGSIPE